MNISNKKIFIGFVIAFILVLNIYNIPLKGNDSQLMTQNNQQFEEQQPFDINALNTAINQSVESNYTLSDYKKIIVTFWATWCPSCQRENVIFNDVVKKYNKELLILGISVDKDQMALGKYLKNTPLNFPVFYNNKDIALLFDDIVAVPTHYIIDVKTNSIRKTMGLMDEKEIENIMKEKL